MDPFEAEQVEADKAAKKLMLENLSRTELIQRRREKDAKDKERNKRRQEWKDSRLQRMQQARALQVCGGMGMGMVGVVPHRHVYEGKTVYFVYGT